LNVTHYNSVFADGVILLGNCVHTIKENTEHLLVAIKEIGLQAYS